MPNNDILNDGGMLYKLNKSEGKACFYKLIDEYKSPKVEFKTEVVDDNKIKYEVNEIASNALANRTNIRSVVIPDSIKTIGKSSFSNCRNLRNIFLKSGGKKKKNTISNCNIEESAFNNCSKLKKLTLENCTLASKCFENCKIVFKNITNCNPKNFNKKISNFKNQIIKKIDGKSLISAKKNMSADLLDFYSCFNTDPAESITPFQIPASRNCIIVGLILFIISIIKAIPLQIDVRVIVLTASMLLLTYAGYTFSKDYHNAKRSLGSYIYNRLFLLPLILLILLLSSYLANLFGESTIALIAWAIVNIIAFIYFIITSLTEYEIIEKKPQSKKWLRISVFTISIIGSTITFINSITSASNIHDIINAIWNLISGIFG